MKHLLTVILCSLALACGEGADAPPVDPVAQLLQALGIPGANGTGDAASGPNGLGDTRVAPNGLGEPGGSGVEPIGRSLGAGNGLGERGGAGNGLGDAPGVSGERPTVAGLCADLCGRAAACGLTDDGACFGQCQSALGLLPRRIAEGIPDCVSRGCGGFERCVERLFEDDDDARSTEISAPGEAIDGTAEPRSTGR